jgi:hypothetical protein
MNLILILVIVQTCFLGWIWLSGRLPAKSEKTQKPVVEEVTRQEPASIIEEEVTQPAITQAQDQELEDIRSFVDDPIRIQILNGCGVPRIARRVADCMRNKGYDVRETGNAARFNYSKTRVICRVDDASLARLTANDLGVAEISVDPDPKLVDVEVTIILGNDYNSLNCP